MSEFFSQLRIFSQRVFKAMRFARMESPWIAGDFDPGLPDGVIIHYTDSDAISGTLSWFMKAELAAKVSAHVVIDRGWPDALRKEAHGLPLVEALPAAVVECVPWHRMAQHSTWMNQRAYGIELVNLGEIRRRGAGFVSWRASWNLPYDGEPVAVAGRYWDAYPKEQLSALITVIRELRAIKLLQHIRPELILGHEHVQSVDTACARLRDKRDPGPHFPMPFIRDWATDSREMRFATWLDKYAEVPDFMDRIRAYRLRAFAAMRGVPLSGDEPEVIVRAQDVFYSAFDDAFFAGRSAFGPLGWAALSLLGYAESSQAPDSIADCVLDVDAEQFTASELVTIRAFQRMAGLVVDGQPGPKTRRALAERLVDRGVAAAAGVSGFGIRLPK
jgi:N-acetyl-anhydromuramyl-L-alanine amidase AmpD